MSFQPNEVDNPFPRPPERFRLFTDRNLSLLKTLRERTGTEVHDLLPDDQTQDDVLEEENLEGVAENLIELEPPRVDWVIEGGQVEVFGRWHDACTGNYARDPRYHSAGTRRRRGDSGHIVDNLLRLSIHFIVSDIRPHLKKLLRTILHSYYTLLGGTAQHLPVDDNIATVFDLEASFMMEISRAFLSAVNSVRPLQARQTLEQLLVRQLETRREETRKIHEKCDSIEATLAALKAKAAEIQQQQVEGLENLSLDDTIPKAANVDGGEAGVADSDVFQWANEVS
ncbi:Mediator of RNA polymerase II transcription subunit 7 [Tulasnella sp. 424]|nr:Mediator of RNA polymerase II transcription subunit 7 [Tulasnella sp. 424]